MKTIEIKLFKFNELSEEAKQTAIDNYRNGPYFDDFWGPDRLASYKAAEKIYKDLRHIQEKIKGARLVAWIQNNLSHLWTDTNRISKHADGKIKNSYFQYKYDNPVRVKLSKVFKTNNLENCPLTGVCYDFDFLQPIIDFLRNPDKNTTNLDLEIPSYEEITQKDFDWMNTDEYIIEEIENRYDGEEFTEDGEIY
jgi:hypothetical protein